MKRILLQWVLPFAVTIGLLALAISFIDEPQKIPGYIASVPWWVHILFVAISVVSFYCRAIRWRALLPEFPLTARQCFGPLMIGFMMNGLFPARAGEFARCVALGRKCKMPFSAAFGSVVLERLFDGVILLASFALILSMLGTSLPEEITFKDWQITGDQLNTAIKSMSAILIIIVLGVFTLLVPAVRRLFETVANKVLPQKIAHFAVDQLEKLVAGFRSLHSPVAIIVIVFWTLVVWALVALSCQAGAWGFPDIAHMSFLQAWAVMVFVCIFILLPASPGYWGLYEIGVIAACAALGLTNDKGIALAYSVVIHFWQIATTVMLGLYFLWKDGLNLRELRTKKDEEELESEAAS